MCAWTVFSHPAPEITQLLYPTFSSRVVARYKRGSGCGALRSVFILAMPPFTTLKISPSFGFCLTDSLSENCTALAAPPPPTKLGCTLLKPHSGEIKIRSSLKFPSNTSPVGLCVKYHVTGFSRVYCLKLRLGPAFIFQKWMPWGDGEGWGCSAEYNFCDLKKSSNPLLFCTVILTNG